MAIELQDALDSVEDAAAVLFQSDPLTRSVGVTLDGGGVEFCAVRNLSAPVPFALSHPAPSLPETFRGISIRYLNSTGDPKSLVQVPHSGPGSPGVASLIQEQKYNRPLVCGLQIQNFDNDLRTGTIARGLMTVGTLGCFVELSDGRTALLSNNHVVAGENQGLRGTDRVLQPGGGAFDPEMSIAILTDFKDLVPSAQGAMFPKVTLNEIDAGIAVVELEGSWLQAYLPHRVAKAPSGIARAQLNDKVHKVGRTTGLTYGVVKQVGTVVGPVGYGIGECWFRRSFVVESENGTTFSDKGDSGSAIVRDSDGAVLGLLYAGNGTQTYACPIATVFAELKCSLR